VMIEEVIRHRLGVPEHEHPYFDDIDMVGPGEETILGAALGGSYTIDDLIEVARPHLKGHWNVTQGELPSDRARAKPSPC